uniref:Uncharacterized protein n=1 Tax=Glossina austeni TaxID=7395 RepID=A0A1A9V989_GLOAU
MALCGGGGGLPSSVRYELRAAKFECALCVEDSVQGFPRRHLLWKKIIRTTKSFAYHNNRLTNLPKHFAPALVKSLTSSVEVVCTHTKMKAFPLRNFSFHLPVYNHAVVDPIYVDRPYARDPLSSGTNNDISPLNDRDINDCCSLQSSSRAPAVVILSRKRCKCCICSLASAELLGVTQEAWVVSAEATRELRSSKTFWN